MQTSVRTAQGKVRHIFCSAAISFLVVAIAVSLVQKEREMAATIGIARGDDIQNTAQCARHCAAVSIVIAAMAILSLGIAIVRHETRCWMWVTVVFLLAFYLFLQPLMV